MKQSTLNLLNTFFVVAPIMKGSAVESAEIDAAERTLGVRFSADYREFVEHFGGALVGPYPVFGLRRPEPFDANLWSVVTVTEHFRSQSWPGADKWYIISMDHSGNPIGANDEGQIMSFDHDAGETIEVAPNFEAFIVGCLKSS